MFINNGETFRLDPSTNPSIKWGSLTPSEDFGDADLLPLPVGSLYVSIVPDVSDCGVAAENSSSLWQKLVSDRSGGSSSHWQRVSSSFQWGEVPPVGQQDPWCGMSIGDIYYQKSATCNSIYVKVGKECIDGDWLNLSESQNCYVVGYGCPDGESLADLRIGAWYADVRSNSHILYVKLAEKGKNTDWFSTNTLAIVQLEDLSGDDAACLPVGTMVVETGLDCPISWIKTGDTGDLAVDFTPMSDVCVLTGSLPPDPVALAPYPVGTYWWQVPIGEGAENLWVKIGGASGSSDDWFLLTPEISIDTITVATGTTPPDGASLSTAILGSLYLQTPTGHNQTFTWEKVFLNGDDDDWQIQSESPVLQESADVIPANFTNFPMGLIHVNSATKRTEIMVDQAGTADSFVTIRPDAIFDEASANGVAEALGTNQTTPVVLPGGAGLLTLLPVPDEDVGCTLSFSVSVENQYQSANQSPSWGNWLNLGLRLFVDGALASPTLSFNRPVKIGWREKGQIISAVSTGILPEGTSSIQLGYTCTPEAGPGIDLGLLVTDWDVSIRWRKW